jgi:hypothetical protein
LRAWIAFTLGVKAMSLVTAPDDNGCVTMATLRGAP